MTRFILTSVLLSVFILLNASNAHADCQELSRAQQASLIHEHVFGGIPSRAAVLVRRAYVAEYDPARRGPRWTAWRVAPEHRELLPPRSGAFSSFREDPDIADPVSDEEYVGLFATADNYARGHLAPYFIAGGDRDHDGVGAAAVDGGIADRDDACTVFEVNYMSNIAPQKHHAFNGSGGLWYELETATRAYVDSGRPVHVFAGSIYGAMPVQFVGPRSDIAVPDMFFKIIVTREGAAAFLFAHRRTLHEDACGLEAELMECIVPVGTIENLTGLDFFNALPDPVEYELEVSDGRLVWDRTLGATPG